MNPRDRILKAAEIALNDGLSIGAAVVRLGELAWYCPGCGVLYSRDEDATTAPAHPNPLDPDANCTGTPRPGLWIPDDPEEAPR